MNKAITKAQEVASQTLFLDNQGNTPMAFHNEPFDRHGSSQYVEAEQIAKLVQSRIVHTRPLQSINSYSRPTSSPAVVQEHKGQCLQKEYDVRRRRGTEFNRGETIQTRQVQLTQPNIGQPSQQQWRQQRHQAPASGRLRIQFNGVQMSQPRWRSETSRTCGKIVAHFGRGQIHWNPSTQWAIGQPSQTQLSKDRRHPTHFRRGESSQTRGKIVAEFGRGQIHWNRSTQWGIGQSSQTQLSKDRRHPIHLIIDQKNQTLSKDGRQPTHVSGGQPSQTQGKIVVRLVRDQNQGLSTGWRHPTHLSRGQPYQTHGNIVARFGRGQIHWNGPYSVEFGQSSHTRLNKGQMSQTPASRQSQLSLDLVPEVLKRLSHVAEGPSTKGGKIQLNRNAHPLRERIMSQPYIDPFQQFFDPVNCIGSQGIIFSHIYPNVVAIYFVNYILLELH